MLDPLVTRLSALVGPDVAIASSEVGSEDGLLAPEHDAIANAIPKRRAEFAAGRRAARYALASAGRASTAIPMVSTIPAIPGKVSVAPIRLSKPKIKPTLIKSAVFAKTPKSP